MKDKNEFKEIKLSDIQTKNYEKERERNGEIGNECIICGKPTKEEYWVHMTTDLTLVPNDVNEDDCDSQGCFPIGSSCKNKLPKNYITHEA